MNAEGKIAVQSNGKSKSEARAPSIIPASGFSEYTNRSLWGMRLVEQTTGETNIQTWSKIGSIVPTSRYRTLSAAQINPTARANAASWTTKTGNISVFQLTGT